MDKSCPVRPRESGDPGVAWKSPYLRLWIPAFAGMNGVCVAIALTLAAIGPSRAQPAEEFFKGKTIRFVLGAAPGQDYDVWARFLARHLPRHIPGNPGFVVQNMPGAGHMRAANWLYNVAPRDGTVWGSVSRNIPAVGLQHLPGVQFDPLKFNWIGSPELTNRGCFAMTKNPHVHSAADLFDHELVVGGTGAGSTVTETPKLLRGLLGMKFKVVEGYVKPQDAQYAMETGELDGMCSTVQSFRNFRPAWIRSGTARVLFTLEQDPVPWTKAPTIYQFIKTDEQRQTLAYFSSSIEYGRPLLLPPEVPNERVQMLRRAFEMTVKDQQFVDEAHKLGMEVTLRTGEQLEALIRAAKETSPEIIERVTKIIQSSGN
jgi:tripartite-type tricarboxylate transporter receptor subunit TctC